MLRVDWHYYKYQCAPTSAFTDEKFCANGLIFSCHLNALGIITVLNLFQDCFSCGMNILREFILCGWRQFVLFRQKSKSVSTWLTVSSVKHQPEGACLIEETERKEGRKEGRKETIQILLFPSSIFSIVLQREGKQLVGDKSIDVSGKFENKECALDTRNCFTFVVSHWTEDNRLSQYFIEHDFQW